MQSSSSLFRVTLQKLNLLFIDILNYCRYGGKGSKIPEGIIFEGASDDPISVRFIFTVYNEIRIGFINISFYRFKSPGR